MILDTPALDPSRRSHLRLMQANQRDASYICELRADETLNRYLNPSSADVAAQTRWLEGYKAREADGEEFYFAIVSDGEDRGVVRMYDFRELEGKKSFCWGSWILPAPRLPGLVTFSAVMMYELGFDELGFEQCHFDVRKGNVGVLAFHERAGAHRVSEDDLDVFFRFYPDDYARFRTASAAQIAAHRATVPILADT